MKRRMLSLQVSPDKREKIKARLLASLIEDKETGCWNWVRSKNVGGYGLMRVVPADGKDQMYMVHRVAYALFVGDIPENMCICHRCDNRSCANPEHLFLGTLNDNIQDRKNKDRSARMFGESNPFSKDDDHKYPQTALLFAKIRLNRQANELSRQRDRIFELKRKLKVLARVISRKHAEVEELRRDMAILIAEG